MWEVRSVSAETSGIHHGKRAVSIKPGENPDGNGATRVWPKKTLTYAFVDDDAAEKLRPIIFQARQYWSQLDIHGFKYKEITLDRCNLDRDECLLVHYNDRGYRSTTPGRPPLESKTGYVGPNMYLSDNPKVGNLDANLNVAHEIGHPWGLMHEHQKDIHWEVSDMTQEGWNVQIVNENRDIQFETDDFRCRNLKDYEEAFQKIDERAKEPEEAADDKKLLCRTWSTAKKYGFSGAEWLPMKTDKLDADPAFDPVSLMLYPSNAGGIGEVNGADDDQRLPILTYRNGDRIPIRTGASVADIDKLISIYGDKYKGVSNLLNSKDNYFRRTFRKVRSTLSLKGGDTNDGVC